MEFRHPSNLSFDMADGGTVGQLIACQRPPFPRDSFSILLPNKSPFLTKGIRRTSSSRGGCTIFPEGTLHLSLALPLVVPNPTPSTLMATGWKAFGRGHGGCGPGRPAFGSQDQRHRAGHSNLAPVWTRLIIPTLSSIFGGFVRQDHHYYPIRTPLPI